MVCRWVDSFPSVQLQFFQRKTWLVEKAWVQQSFIVGYPMFQVIPQAYSHHLVPSHIPSHLRKAASENITSDCDQHRGACNHSGCREHRQNSARSECDNQLPSCRWEIYFCVHSFVQILMELCARFGDTKINTNSALLDSRLVGKLRHEP